MTTEPARPSGLLEGQTNPAAREKLQTRGETLRRQYGPPDDTPERPAEFPRPAGQAAASPVAAATPGAPIMASARKGAPGPDPSFSLPPGQASGEEEAQTSGPGHVSQDAVPGAGLQAWKDEIAKQNRAKRNRRGKRPGPQITGVRIPPPGGAA